MKAARSKDGWPQRDRNSESARQVCFAVFFSVLCLQSWGQSAIDWSTVDGGGGTSSGGSVTISGTVGQADTGAMSGGGVSVQGGFWSFAAVAAPPAVPTITWTGGGDGVSWSNPANWSRGSLPVATDDVAITGGAGVSVLISSGNISVRSLQCTKAFTLAGGSLTLTKGGSQISGTFAITNGASLTVNGADASLTASGPATANGGSLYAVNGGGIRLPHLTSVTNQSVSPTWRADGAGCVIDLAGLTNLVVGYYDVQYVQSYRGGVVNLPALRSVSGAVRVNARDAGTRVDLSGLSGRWTSTGSSPLRVEAQGGASLWMPNVTQLENAILGVKNAAFITTAQLNLLTNVSVTADAATPDFGGVTNIDDTSVYALNGGVARLTNVVRVTHGNQSPTWRADGTNSLVDLSRLTNLVLGYYEVLYVQAYDSGAMDLHRLAGTTGAVRVDARDAGTRVDLSGLAGRWKSTGSSPLRLEAQGGASIWMPNVTHLENAILGVETTGYITTAQLSLLTNVALTVDAATADFGAVTNIDDTSVYALNGGVARLTNVVRATHGNQSPTWRADGTNSLVDLSRLTNVALGYYEVLYVQAYDSGAVDLHRLGSTTGAVRVDARDSGTVVDLSGLAGRWKSTGSSPLRLEAQSEASIAMPNVTQLENAVLGLENAGFITTAQLNLLTNVTLTVDAATVDFERVTNIDDTSVYALNGGVARLTNVVRVTHGNQNPTWRADGAGSLVDVSRLTTVVMGYYEVLYVQAYNGGKVNLSGLVSLATGVVRVVADGSGSAVDLSRLSSFISLGSGPSSLTARNGGNILLNGQALILANVNVSIPAGQPILPATLTASPVVTLYGVTGKCYGVESRDTRSDLNPWVFLGRVCLTNSAQTFAQSASPNQQLRVGEFVEAGPVLGLTRRADRQLQLTIYDAPGMTNQLLSATNAGAGATWQPGSVIVMTNTFQFLTPVDAWEPVRFYRARRL